MSSVRPIHPFPARMAPEIALAACAELRSGSVVLDPMCGSGTTLRAATESGHSAIGVDMDPLAVLMAKVFTTPLPVQEVSRQAAKIRAEAQNLNPSDFILPWLDDDPETQDFINFWFAPPQQLELRKLAYLLSRKRGAVANALKVALSRIIITKEKSASLARDTSHSRPHRVGLTNSFQVLDEFVRSAEILARRLEGQPPARGASVSLGDARKLKLPANSVDAVITSPPYLNAIDYLRGHRLALVWLGYRVCDIRPIRAESIGTERGLAKINTLDKSLPLSLSFFRQLSPRDKRIFERYYADLVRLFSEVGRVLKPGGEAIFVVGNSSIKGVFVLNTETVKIAGDLAGLSLTSEVERVLPQNRRYLPPPGSVNSAAAGMNSRMRTETILKFSAN